jgi:hypothetical protein
MKHEHPQIQRNRKAVVSLIIGMVSLLYGLVLIHNFWLTLSAFDEGIFIFAMPIVLLGCIAIALGFLSIRNIGLSKGTLKGKASSILGILFGVLSLALPLLPRASFMAHAFLNPPNYELVLQLQGTPAQNVTLPILEKAEKIVASRLQYVGVPCEIETMTPDKIHVRLRVGENFKKEYLQNLLKSGLLSFHLVHQDNVKLALQLSLPEFRAPQGFKPVARGKETLFVKSEPELVDGVDDAQVRIDEASQPYIAVRFKPEAAQRISRMTREHIGRRFAIMVDETVYSAPVIREPIAGGDAQIMGNFTREEARDFAIVLRSGALPVPIRVTDGRYLK